MKIINSSIPNMYLDSTRLSPISLSEFSDRLILFCFPMIGNPNKKLPDNWDKIPGAMGCTSQACSYKKKFELLKHSKYSLFGISTQKVKEQMECKMRLQLPYDLLSDVDLRFQKHFDLPTFSIENKTYLKRLTIIVRQNKIEKIFHPILNPEGNINDVIHWIKHNDI